MEREDPPRKNDVRDGDNFGMRLGLLAWAFGFGLSFAHDFVPHGDPARKRLQLAGLLLMIAGALIFIISERIWKSTDKHEPDGPRCGQCGILLKPGRSACHFCGWQMQMPEAPTGTDSHT